MSRSVAVVAGGKGTRLRHLPGAAVKVLAPVGSEPFLLLLLRRLRELGTEHVHLCLGHGADAVSAWLADASLPLPVSTSVEETPLGVYGALRLAAESLSDPFTLVYGDVLPATAPADLEGALTDGADAVIAAWANGDVGEPSNLRVRDGWVTRYEKNVLGLTHVDVGMTLLRRDVVTALPPGVVVTEADVLAPLAARGALAAYETDGPNLHVGDPDSYAQLLAAVRAEPPAGVPEGRPALLLLDRDGVLLEHVEPYVLRRSDVRPVSGAIEAAAAFGRAGVRLAIVSNQSPLARGLVDEAFVRETNEALVDQLARLGAPGTTVHVCPHDDAAACSCRKPRPGLLIEAAAAGGVDPGETWMAGDHDVDMLAALRAGCAARVHVRSGRQPGPSPYATSTVRDLPALARGCGMLP